jgi:hypothetical protein
MSLKLAALGLLSLLALAGCATSSQNTASPRSATESPASTGALVTPTATKNTSLITLTTDRTRYQPGDSVRVTIANGQSVSVYAVASKANCTILDLQVKASSGWQVSNAAPCNAPSDAQSVEIKPHASTVVTITAPATGTYRCALQYTTITIPPPRDAPSGASDAIADATKTSSGPAAIAYSAEWNVTSA